MSNRGLIGGIIICLVIILVSWTALNAAWLDDWYSSAVVSGPDSYRGEQRGYMSLGQRSYRWQPNPEVNLVTLQTPRMKAGCGGLDLFLGGMSFANLPDLLVNKFQALVASAPSVAFQVALSVLNQNIEGAMKDIEAATNFLNGLQVDDCSIQQGMFDSISAGVKNKDALASVAVASDAIMNSQMVSGLSSSFHAAKQTIFGSSIRQANNDTFGDQEGTGALSACPSSAFIQQFLVTPSVLNFLLNQRGYDADTIELARGIVGDISKPTVMEARYIPPCSENHPNGFEVFMSSGGWGRHVPADATQDGACYQMSGSFTYGGETFADLETWASTLITRAGNSISNKAALDATTRQFLESAPVYQYIKMAVAMDQLANIRSSLTDMTAKYFIFNLVSDLMLAIETSLDDANRIVSRSANTDPSCQTTAAYTALGGPLSELREKLQPIADNAAHEFYYSNDVLVSRFQQMTMLRAQFDGLMGEFASKFGTSLAARLSVING